ncbi:PTS transporter subunit EIIC [Clostridium butyricum]|uniref:PTS sugar transporter subunit IIC n=1 Tax=Clostridium butyricum TaxID=1492 RepID=UPI0013679F3A|nr:PTS transporter subunit EIIC [Clostridium butyricum]MZI82721.1 PTS transporter subunit EIIC [Clostridium butyricum]
MKNFFDKFSEVLERKLMPLADKVGKQRHLSAVKDGMLAYVPFTIIASIFLIIAYVPIPAYQNLITNLLGVESPEVWQGKLLYVSNATMDVGGLYVLIAATYSLSKSYNINKLQSILTALGCFLIVTPYTATEAGNMLSITRVGAQAMFLALIVCIISVEIYRRVEEKGLTIKMPAAVPPAVAKPFESIIPALLSITVFFVLRLIFEITLQSDLFTVINLIIGKPLLLLGGTLPGMILSLLFEQLLWFFGLHGGSIVQGAMTPIWTVLEDANRLASVAGEVPPNIISLSFRNSFASIGIVGAIIALVIVAKSKQYKEIGKVAAVPYVFNIGEPTLFGIPLMLNPIYFVPLVITPSISAVISYAAFATKLVPLPTGLAQLPWTTPPIVSGYLVTGSIRGALLQVVLLVVVTLIWIPFIKMADRKICREEAAFES